MSTLFRLDVNPSVILTPVASHHVVEQIDDPLLSSAARTADRGWVRYEQFTPQAQPDLLQLLDLASLPPVTIKKSKSGGSVTYTVTPKRRADPRSWTVNTRSNPTGVEVVNKVVLRDRSGQHTRHLYDAAGSLQVPALGSRITTFSVEPAKNVIAVPAVGLIFDPRTQPELFSATRYDEKAIERLAREVLYDANRISEAVNRTVTGVELSQALRNYLPHRFPGLHMRAVDSRLEITVLRPVSKQYYCAELTRYDYTTESLLLRDGVC